MGNIYEEKVIYNMKCYTGIKTFYCDTDYVKNVRFIGLDEIIDTAYTGYPIKKDIKRKLQATVPDCRIAINSNEETEFIKNTSMKYPILKYRDVLYLPLTWDIISNRLGWKCNFSEKTGLVLDTTRRTKPIVDLHHFASGPSRWIWSMSYCIAPDGWVGYPDNTLEHNYQFKTYLNGQKEVAFSLEDLQDAVYTMNRMMVTTEQAEISKIKPKIEDGIFTIYCVRSAEGEEPQTCRLKINLENQQVIEKVQVDSAEETVKV